MFCSQCGVQVPAGAKFCSACGARVTGQAAFTAAQPVYSGAGRLQRPRTNRMIAGVCSGLARHYGWELTLVRVLTVVIAFFSSGAGLIAYIIFWIVMPEETWLLPASVSDASLPTDSLGRKQA